MLIPAHRTETNLDWLEQAKNSFTTGTRVFVAWNDGPHEIGLAINEAAKAAETTWVLPFGADDIAEPEMVEYLLSYSFNADVVYPSMRLVNHDMSVWLSDFPAQSFCGNRLMFNNFVTGSSLIRRESLLAVGGFRDVRLEDWDLFVRMHRAGMRIKPARPARLLYRRVEGSRNSGLDLAALRDEIVGEPPEILATFYPQSTNPAQTYLRCALPARFLPGVLRDDVIVGRDADGQMVFPEQHGKTAILSFPGSAEEAAHARLLKQAGYRVLVETDDWYLGLNNKGGMLDRSNWGKKVGDASHTMQGHRKIVSEAHGVICTTDYLADLYREHNANVWVAPNTVDPWDWPDPLVEKAKLSPDVFRIGWSASLSHNRDAKQVRRAMEWASRQPGVMVVSHGLNPNWPFRRAQIPFDHDLDAYRIRMSAFDVGVAPVGPDKWERARSGIKAAEYAMGLALPVLQDAPPYAGWTHMEDCLKARNEDGWRKAIRWCVEHQDEARDLARVARDRVLRELTTEAQIGCWREAVEG